MNLVLLEGLRFASMCHFFLGVSALPYAKCMWPLSRELVRDLPCGVVDGMDDED